MEYAELKEILDKSGKKIFNYLLKILRNKEDAEDIYQEVFISFYKRHKNINPLSYESYLFQTAYHKALNYIKKRKKTQTVQLTDNITPTAAYSYEENKKNKIVKDAIKKLKPKEALIIELQFFQKKSYKEIAKILSISESAVDSRLVRAKKKLRKIILQDFKNEFV